ncbi:hypothetical protein GY45DRAFT_576569 [Cubamyces sp. BRFM 1775]|nr:hypothetical protein GY45DRAFT_576569 [Cubamyces sp. BRFM 1775]
MRRCTWISNNTELGDLSDLGLPSALASEFAQVFVRGSTTRARIRSYCRPRNPRRAEEGPPHRPINPAPHAASDAEDALDHRRQPLHFATRPSPDRPGRKTRIRAACGRTVPRAIVIASTSLPSDHRCTRVSLLSALGLGERGDRSWKPMLPAAGAFRGPPPSGTRAEARSDLPSARSWEDRCMHTRGTDASNPLCVRACARRITHKSGRRMRQCSRCAPGDPVICHGWMDSSRLLGERIRSLWTYQTTVAAALQG